MRVCECVLAVRLLTEVVWVIRFVRENQQRTKCFCKMRCCLAKVFGCCIIMNHMLSAFQRDKIIVLDFVNGFMDFRIVNH